jgi:hypothetical protein
VVVAAWVVTLSAGLWVKFGLVLLIAGSATVALCVALDVAASTLSGRFRGPPLPVRSGEPAIESPP